MIWLVAAAAALASAPHDLRAQSLVIHNARLIDGTGAPPRGPLSILIRDGRIAEIAPDIAAAACRRSTSPAARSFPV